jgi:hypothetical protein
MPLVGFASEFKRAGSSLRIEETDLSITNRAVSDMFDPHFVGSQNAKQIDRSSGGRGTPSRIFLIQWPNSTKVELKEDKATGRTYVSYSAWKAYLGNEQFALPFDWSGTSFDSAGSPSYRSLFSYFARRWHAGGCQHPERCRTPVSEKIGSRTGQAV